MKIAIAGGGLVGALCANIMGQKGHEVELFEYRQDPRRLDAKLSRGKSINLALSTRGRTTLARAGLENLIISHGIPMKGRMLHSLTGARKEVLYDPNGHQTSQHALSVVKSETLEDLEPPSRFEIDAVNAAGCRAV